MNSEYDSKKLPFKWRNYKSVSTFTHGKIPSTRHHFIFWSKYTASSTQKLHSVGQITLTCIIILYTFSFWQLYVVKTFTHSSGIYQHYLLCIPIKDEHVALEKHTVTIFIPEDGDRMFRWNIGIHHESAQCHDVEQQHSHVHNYENLKSDIPATFTLGEGKYYAYDFSLLFNYDFWKLVRIKISLCKCFSEVQESIPKSKFKKSTNMKINFFNVLGFGGSLGG